MMLFCIGVHLWFSYMVSNNQKTGPKFDARRCQSSLHKKVHSGASLLDEFAKHPCCSKNCIVQKVGLSAPTDGYCSSCYGSTNPFSGPTISCKSHISEAQRQVEFLEVVTANRAAYDEYRHVARDTPEVTRDKKKNLHASLMHHFKTHGTQVGPNWSWEEAYYIRDASMNKIMVCKEAWCAIIGITSGGVEYIQGQVRKGYAPNALLDDNRERVDVGKAFLHWGINVNTYHYYIGAFCVLSAIPQTEASLVAAAWCSDYFDLVGEAQPNVIAIHYDQITIGEIHAEYASDPFVHDIILLFIL